VHALRDADPSRGAGPAIDVLLSALPEALKPRRAARAKDGAVLANATPRTLWRTCLSRCQQMYRHAVARGWLR
jgi:hypothetical protein